jgi:hypothetical protein
MKSRFVNKKYIMILELFSRTSYCINVRAVLSSSYRRKDEGGKDRNYL